MAVEIVYRSSRDPEQLFMDKAQADRHDEGLGEVLQKAVPQLGEQLAEEVSIYMARNREIFAKAFKSNAEALAELEEPGEA